MDAHGGVEVARRCRSHPDRASVVTCSRCGDYACANCFDVSRQGDDYCLTCMAMVVRDVASRMDRLLAYLVNVGVTMFVMFLPLPLLLFARGQEYAGPDVANLMLALMGLCAAALAGVNIYLLATRGQSIGKLVMKIRIVADDGTPAGIFTLLVLRLFIPQVFSSLCGLFALVDNLAIFREDSRCIHDHIANTIVVKVNPGAPTEF